MRVARATDCEKILAYLDRDNGRYLRLAYQRHAARDSLELRAYGAEDKPEGPGVRVRINELPALLEAVAAVERLAEAAQ